MGTTRIKVIDLSSEQQEVKTARKHAEKLTGISKLTTKKKPKEAKEQKPATTESTEKLTTTGITDTTEAPSTPVSSVSPSVSSAVARKHTRHTGKKYKQAQNLIDKNKLYPPKEAIELLGKISYSKFDPTVEIHLNVADKNIKGSVNMPHPIGKKRQKIILVFTDKKLPQDKNIIIGNVKTIDDIQNGKLRPARDFNAVIAEPKFMPELVKIAKILGPAGLMPNPKDKTIVDNPQDSIQKFENEKAGFEYKTDPTAPIIHSFLGKLSAKPDYLEENLKTIILAIGPTKIKKAVIKSSMSPAISLDITSLAS